MAFSLGGLFKGIGNSLLAPIKSAGSILSGKGNLGDLLNIGLAIAPGGNLANIGKASAGSFLSNMGNSILPGALFGGMSGSSQGGAGGMSGSSQGGAGGFNFSDNSGVMNAYSGLANSFLPLAIQELQDYPNLVRQRRMYVNRALDANNPGNWRAMGDALRARLMGGTESTAQTMASRLGDYNLLPALRLGAMNDATGEANSYMADLYTPEKLYGMNAQNAGLVSGEMQGPMLERFVSLLGAISGANNQAIQSDVYRQANRQPTFGERLFEAAPNLINAFMQFQNQRRSGDQGLKTAAMGQNFNYKLPSGTIGYTSPYKATNQFRLRLGV